MEKPTERTRDGMARESEASTPGPTMASEKSMPALPTKASGTLGAEREEHGERGGDERGHRQHAEDEADVAPGQAGGDDGADGEASEVEELDRRNEVGAVHRIEMERLLILQRGEGREPRDGGGEEGQGDEDAAQHADLPDGPPGLAERGRGLDREVDDVGWREGGGTSPSGAGSPRSEATICSLSSSCSWRPRGGSRRRRPTIDHEHDGHGEEEEGGAPGEHGGQAGAEQDADDGADADARAVGRVDPRPGRDRVVVGQQRVVRGEDHGLSHGDAHQHDGGHHDALGDAEADGERGADQRADQRDAHPVGAVGQDGDGERAGQRRRAGDGDDQEDAGVGEMERVADVRRQHVEGALGGLVEQLDPEQHPEGEEGGARTELGQAAHGTSAPSTGPVTPGEAARRRRASRSSAQSRTS